MTKRRLHFLVLRRTKLEKLKRFFLMRLTVSGSPSTEGRLESVDWASSWPLSLSALVGLSCDATSRALSDCDIFRRQGCPDEAKVTAG